MQKHPEHVREIEGAFQNFNPLLPDRTEERIDNHRSGAIITLMEKLRLLIIWHSRTGASEAMARAAYDGAMQVARGGDLPVRQLSVDLLAADMVSAADLLDAAGYLFVCPENLAGMSGAMKEMFDRCYYPVLGHIEGRAYATMIAAGSDGEGAERQIDRIVTGWRLRRVADSLIVNLGAQLPEEILAVKNLPENKLRHCREVGSGMAEGLLMGIF